MEDTPVRNFEQHKIAPLCINTGSPRATCIWNDVEYTYINTFFASSHLVPQVPTSIWHSDDVVL